MADSSSKPPLTAQLRWDGDLRFTGETGRVSVVLDGAGRTGPSPMQAVALGLAGCMAIDVVHILTRGRHPLERLEASFTGRRAPGPPARFVSMSLHFQIAGDVPSDQVERAIALSREKYCSVWHSLREDISLDLTFDVVSSSASGSPQGERSHGRE